MFECECDNPYLCDFQQGCDNERSHKPVRRENGSEQRNQQRTLHCPGQNTEMLMFQPVSGRSVWEGNESPQPG